MTTPPRIVDAHVHLWDPARTDWYPYLKAGDQLGMGDVSGMNRRFDVPTYRAESARWNVEKLVNVAAATGGHSIAETLDLDRRADGDPDAHGHPDAIVGGLPPADSVADAISMIDEQMVATRFRGVRPMGPSSAPVPADDILRALAERSLVFELMAHPDQLGEAARRLGAVDDLIVVVEHAGWPRTSTPEEFALWKEGMLALADVGGNVHCKLSGLAMPLGEISEHAFRPWIELALEAFGIGRCFFASNFPVDGVHGTFDDLFDAYTDVTSDFDSASIDQLYATNAERLYRI